MQPHVNSIVSSRDKSRYGVVTRIFTHGSRTLANVHYIDAETGQLMACPDSRCESKDPHCPIHQFSEDLHRLDAWKAHDVTFYQHEGMICASLAKKANATQLRIERRRGGYRVCRVQDGMRLGMVTFDARSAYSESERAKDILQGQTSCTLSDPDNDDYKLFDGLFSVP